MNPISRNILIFTLSTLFSSSLIFADQGPTQQEGGMSQSIQQEIGVIQQKGTEMREEMQQIVAQMQENRLAIQKLQHENSVQRQNVPEYQRQQEMQSLELAKEAGFWKRNGTGIKQSFKSTFGETKLRIKNFAQNGSRESQINAISNQSQYLQTRYNNLDVMIKADAYSLEALTAISQYESKDQENEIYHILLNAEPSYDFQMLQYHCTEIHYRFQQSGGSSVRNVSRTQFQKTNDDDSSEASQGKSPYQPTP